MRTDDQSTRRRVLQMGAALGMAPLALRSRSAFSAETTKLTMIKGPHSANEVAYEKEIIADFNKTHPNVDIDFTMYNWGSMNAQLTAGFASGSPADVLYLVDLVYPAYAKRGLLNDMTKLVDDPAWKSEHDAIAPFAWNLAKSKNGTWGVPVLGAVYNIFLNLDLLDKAGVTGTWQRSYADMLAAAQKMTKGDTSTACRCAPASPISRSGTGSPTSTTPAPTFSTPTGRAMAWPVRHRQCSS